MKKMLALLAFTASAYSMSAHAFVTQCEIDLASQDQFPIPVVVNIGEVKGTATCWDITGQATKTKLKGLLVGGGLEAGYCSMSAHYSAIGAGFALDNLIDIIPQVNLTPFNNQGVALAANVSPLGVNAELAISNVKFSNCGSLASGSVSTLFKDGASMRAPKLDRRKK
jgi:hypothetical protein